MAQSWKLVAGKKKGPAAPTPLSVSITATASGSAGYFTSSIIDGINRIYTGATTFVPTYITFSTSSVVGGTAPYTSKWTSSMSYFPPGYTSGTETGSFTGTYYSYESDRWTVTVTDSSTPAKVASASIDSIIYGIDYEMVVGTYQGITGSDTQTFNSMIVPGGVDAPLATITAAYRYAVRDWTYILAASGTYYENPIISKKTNQLQSLEGPGSASLGPGNYFIYDTKEHDNLSLRGQAYFAEYPFNFPSSSFNIIGVTPSGSIQSAMYDVEPTGTVKILAGIHEITTPVSLSLGKAVLVDGVYVPTGSNDSYYYSPTSIIRNSANGNAMFMGTAGVNQNLGGPHKFSNLALELSTGSFFIIDNGCSRDVILEMVRMRIISASVPYDMESLAANPNSGPLFNTGSANWPPAERNPWRSFSRRHILDGNVSGYGSGYIYPGPHCTRNSIQNWTGSWPITFTSSLMLTHHDYEAVGVVTTVAITSGSTRGNPLASNFATTNLSSPLSALRRPFIGNNINLFNGLYFLNFDGVDDYYDGSLFTWLSQSSAAGMCVFSPNDVSKQQVISKFGDSRNGVSFVLTGTSSKFAISFYATASGATSSVSMTADVAVGSQYLAEFFFDGSSTNKRVGMALYSTSSLITSSYYSSTDFPANMTTNTNNGVAAVPTIAASGGDFRYGNFIKATGTGRDNFCAVRWVHSSFYTYTNSHKNFLRDEAFAWAMRKWFPSGSAPTRSISADS